jgi:hypothetical protein
MASSFFQGALRAAGSPITSTPRNEQAATAVQTQTRRSPVLLVVALALCHRGNFYEGQSRPDTSKYELSGAVFGFEFRDQAWRQY